MKKTILIIRILSFFLGISFRSMAEEKQIKTRGSIQYQEEIYLAEKDFIYLRNELIDLEEEIKEYE